MKISFVIPAYNEEDYIGSCLESILAEKSPDVFEIVVIDNASHDKTAEVAQRYPGVRVVAESRRGTNWARERGHKETSGEFIAYIDADTRLPHGWIDIARKAFAENPKLVSLSGPFRYYDLPPAKNFLANILWKVFAPISYRITGYMILGANFIVRRTALDAIGGFDTTILFHGDDTNTARRLSKIGEVKFRMDFFILGSGRRLLHDGLTRTFWLYGMNYLWSAWKKEPYTKGYGEKA